jgi:hypothetical protein
MTTIISPKNNFNFIKSLKMKTKIIILSVLSISLFAVILLAQQDKRDDAIPNKKIEEALQTFIKIVEKQGAGNFGIKSVDELKGLQQGIQFQKSMIELEALRKFNETSDVNQLIKKTAATEVVFVSRDGQIKTGIEFTKNKENWEASSFGLSNELTLLQKEGFKLDSLSKQEQLIMIPSLQTSFLTKQVGIDMMFVPLTTNDSLGLRRGVAMKAKEALLKLVPLANLYNGLPY